MQPRPSWQQTPVIYSLIAINLAIYLTINFVLQVPSAENNCFGGLDIHLVLGRGEYWRLFSSIFIHYQLEHIAFNLVALLIFGSYAERALGPILTFGVYLFCGLFANLVALISIIISGYLAYCAIGASGAILGLAAGAGFFMWRLWKTNRNPLALVFARQLVIILVIQFLIDFIIPQSSFVHHFSGALGGVLAVSLLLKLRLLRLPER